MTRILVFISLFALISCSNAEKRKEQRELANLHLKIGTGYLTQANYPLAIKELRIANKLDPANPAILNNLGLAYFLRNETQLSIETFEKALKTAPKYTEARNNLARANIEIKKYDDAIANLKIATQDLTYARPEKTWTNLGYAYLKSKKYSLAESSLNKAISLNRNYCPAYTMYGRTLFEKKKFEKAAESLEQAIRKCRDQRFDESVYYSALSNLKLGRVEKARAKLEEVVKRFPDGKFAQKSRSILKMIQ